MSRRKGGMLKPNLGLKSGGLVSRLADHALEDIEESPSQTPTAETTVPVSNSSQPAGPTVKTLKGPAVEWSSSEDEDEDQNEVVKQEEVNELEEKDVAVPVLEFEPAPEEKSAQESLQQQMPQPDPPFQPQITPQHQMAFSGPPVEAPAEERPVMSFEDALSMISKKPKPEEDKIDEIPVEDDSSQKQHSSRRPPVVSKFSSRLGMADPEASDEQKEDVPVDPLEMGIDIGVIRGLDEDERIIVIPPPEAEGESNVEASGEESDHTGVESDNSHSATIQGVKVNFKSGAEIPKLVEEEADIAALDKLEHVLTPLPPSKPEKSEEISKTEEKLQELPAPPTSKVEGKWAWESGNSEEQPTLKVSLDNSSGETTSIVSSIPEKIEKQRQPEKSMDDIQSMLGSTLLDAFNEEELIQAELNDIREINRREILKRKPATVPPPAPKEVAKDESTKEQKHVGFAETVESSDGSPKKEPLKAEEKPKPILKSESSIEESLQGTGFNTPRVQRRAIDAEESSSEDEESEEESEEEETDSDSGSDPYEDSIFAGKGELGSKLEKKQIKYVKPGVPVHPNTDARVQFKLRDEDPQMVTALRKEFRECPEVEIACGPLFEEERWDAVIMPMTNSFGWTDVDPEEEFMKAAKADPVLLKAQIELDHGGELLVGRCILLPGKKDRQRRCKFVIAAPIMRVPILIADTVNPFLAMRASIDAIRKYNSTNRDGQRIRSVLIPGMGHGMIGRMPVHRVAHQIRRAYEIRALERDSDEASKDPGKIVKLHMDLANFKLGSKV